MLRARTARLLLLLAGLGVSPALALKTDQISSDGTTYTVVTVDPARDTLRLYWQRPGGGAPYGRFAALRDRLAARGERLLFATNSGIYAPGLRPLGLHVEAGQVQTGLNLARSGGNFALLPNGVFWLRGAQAGVTETRAYARSSLRPDYASQSGPLLVQGGRLHPAFNRGSSSFKVRSGVGVCRGGQVKFVLSGAPVNFYGFARFFRDQLGCPDALYLDGSISALYTPELGDGQLVEFAGLWGVSAGR